MRRALDSSVRDGHSLHRMFLAFRKTLREKGEGEGCSDPSFLSLFDNGNYTVVTGDGELFNRFCRNKSIGNYSGRKSYTYLSPVQKSRISGPKLNFSLKDSQMSPCA